MLKRKYLSNIFNIKSNHSFLLNLTSWILEEYPDPFYLANITILLPSRRACREIKKCFLQLAKNEAMILPKILAIGDVDYDELFLTEPVTSSVFKSVILSAEKDLVQHPEILRYAQDDSVRITQGGQQEIGFDLRGQNPSQNLAEQDFTLPQGEGNKIDYRLKLISEIKSWNQKTNLFGKNISTAALAEIADNLQTFLDEVEKEGLSLEGLLAIDDGELASHKQQILQFLQYFGSVWQNVLAKDGVVSAVKNRNLMLANYGEYLRKNGSKYPIIAAGSTGSVVEAAELLKTISQLENGRVVLFGLDKNLDENIWQEIKENHPQFMLKKLLERVKVRRKDVVEIAGEKQSDDFVNELCSLTMMPAEFAFAKQDLPISDWGNISKIEIENEFDEARIIALLFRQALETKGKTAALISNDTNLIKLVKANLLAWRIEVDDSSSSNLAECELVNYLFLISEFVANDFSAVNLLAVLKHPLSVVDVELLKILEMKVFRGVVKFFGFDDLILKAESDEDLAEFVKKIAALFQPLIDEFRKEKVDFGKVVELHFDCFHYLMLSWCHPRLRGDDTESFGDIDGNEELLEFYQELLTAKTNFSLEPQSYNQLLKNLLKNYQFRKSGSFHPRLHILSTMEARLMSYDLTIVSGLCDGEFPAKTSDDWLGNKIRAEFGLSSGAKKIGTAAYDFCNYLSNREVVLAYPKNKNNSPTIKSRFLLKLETVLKVNGWQDWMRDGEQYLELLNFDFGQVNFERTNPRPQEKLKKISATDISKWLRNPYYIYAKRILELKPLKQIEQDASFAEFGNFVHKTLEEFVKNYPNVDLKSYGKKIFTDYFPDPTSHLLWWAKFENIAEWFVKYEAELRENLQESFVELEAQAIINGVILTTKIDRINLYLDGSFEIIDYKTGTLPAPKDIKSGLEPQLAVEAIVLSKGEIKNYSGLKISQIKNLQYQNLKGKDQNDVKNVSDVEELILAADVGILKLLKIFNGEDVGYVCCPNFDIYKEDDYWHLGRVGEL
jgi:ATP-dependent helicase/nuclease subunit B